MTSKVFLDYGHGGKDSGAVGSGLKEKDLTMKIGEKIREKLKLYDVEVHTTRQKDVFVDLGTRAKMANSKNCDLFVSIHINAGGGKGGFETFRMQGVSENSKTGKIQSIIHSEIKAKLKGIIDRGKKTANYQVLRDTKMSAILTENLFIDVASDVELLKTETFINETAVGHVNGIVKALGLTKKKTSESTKTYRVVTGSFQTKANAEKRVKELEKQGFESAIVPHEK